MFSFFACRILFYDCEKTLLLRAKPNRIQNVYGTVRYGTVRYGTVRYGMVWYGMVWYGMVWYGMVW